MCLISVFSEQARLLTSGPSLRETAEFTDKNIKFPTDNELVNMLKAYNPVSQLKLRVKRF